MRNEGIFVVEWVAYHTMLGFDRITVYTNNCTDGTDKLLDRLQELGYVRHINNMPPPGASPQINAMGMAMADPAVKSSEWVMHIDADEFLYLEDGNIGKFLDRFGEDTDVIAILWKLFGDSGVERWDGGSVLQEFTQAQAAPLRRVVHHKSMFRPQKFGRCTDHMPKEPNVKVFRVRNAKGEGVNKNSILHPRKSRYKMKFHQLTFANACLHHYSLKSRDVFLMKNDRGDGHGAKHTRYYLNSKLYREYNRNDAEDRSILEFWPAVEAKMAEMRSDPIVSEIEANALKAFTTRRDAVLTDEQIEEWTAKAGVYEAPAPGEEDDDD